MPTLGKRAQFPWENQKISVISMQYKLWGDEIKCFELMSQEFG
jgi:hypothetical protein